MSWQCHKYDVHHTVMCVDCSGAKDQLIRFRGWVGGCVGMFLYIQDHFEDYLQLTYDSLTTHLQCSR